MNMSPKVKGQGLINQFSRVTGEKCVANRSLRVKGQG